MMIEPLVSGQRVGEQRREPQRGEHVGLVDLGELARLDLGDRVHRRDREGVVDDAVDAAERLEGPVAQVDPRVLVGDVGDHGDDLARRSAARSAWSSSSRASVRLAITRSAPILAASSARDRPRPGPMPETTTTLPFSSGTGW